MLIDSLLERAIDGSLDNYLQSLTKADFSTLNSFYSELDRTIVEYVGKLHEDPHNQQIIASLNGISSVKNKVFNRIKEVTSQW